MTNYLFVAEDPYGFNRKIVPKVIELRAGRAVNTIGSATLVVPDKFMPDYWRKDMRFKIYRNGTYLLGNTIWLARKFKQSWTGKFWTITLQDTLSVLKRHIVAYKSKTLLADKTFLNGNEDYADNLMKQYLKENMTSLALDEPERNLGYFFAVEEFKDQGPIVEKTASYAGVFDTITGIASNAAELGTNLYFDVLVEKNQIPGVQYPDILIFRTFKDYLGTSRTNITFGPQNLTDIELEWNYEDEITAVYAGGMGQDEARLVVSQIDSNRIRPSPFGRIEAFIDVNEVDVETVLEDEARAKLRKYEPKITMTAKVVDTPILQFGRDYFYGDQVQTTVGTLSFTSLLDAFTVNYTKGKEDLDLRLRGEIPVL